LPERTYGWIDTIQAGVTAAVGHDVISTEAIVERRNSARGHVLAPILGHCRLGDLDAELSSSP
jgi:hypothetical protein